MAVVKQIGLGTTLSIGTSAGSTTVTAIAGLISLPGPDGTADDVDTSTIDNATRFKTFQRGQVDPGEMTMTLGFGKSDNSQQKIVTAFADGLIRSWVIAFPSTAEGTETFDGYVKSLGRVIEKDAFMTRTVGIKVTGDPGYTST